MDMGGDLRMPTRMVDPGGDMGPSTPAKGREGIDLNVGMLRASFGVHPNQMLLNGRFFLNSGGRLGPLIHNHNHHHEHHNSNGVSFGSGSGSGCDLNFLPNIGGLVNERMIVNENVMPRWRPVAVERCRRVMPPADQGVIDLTDEVDSVNNNGEQLLILQQQQQQQIEHHVDLGLSREQNVVLAEDVRVPSSESGEGEAVIVAPEGLDCQQLAGEKQCVIGEEQVIDLNKTPQQKPRRKKHRPKVVREGKPARRGRKATPKPVTPKPTERPTGKRKYVRRKNVSNPVEPPLEAVGECVESEDANGVKSVRRSLNFASEGAPMSVPMSSLNAHSLEFRDRSVGGVCNFSSLNGGGSPAMHAGMSSQTRMPLDLCQLTSQNPTWFENQQISKPNAQLLGRGYATINHVSGEFRGNLGIPAPYPQFQERGYRNIIHAQRELRGNPEIPTSSLQPSRNGMVRDNLNSLAASSDIRFRDGLNGSLSDLLLKVTGKDHDANKKRKLEEQNRLPYKAPKNWNLDHVGQTRPGQFTFADAQRFIAIEKMKASEVMVASHPIKRNESMISDRSFQANSLMLAISSTVNHNLLTMTENPCGDGILSSKDPVTPAKLSSRQNRGHDGVIRKPRTPRGIRSTDNHAKAKTRNTKEKFPPGSGCGNANANNTPRHEAVANQENHSRCLKISSIQDCQSSSDFQESAHSTITYLGLMPYRDPVDDIIQKLAHMSINRTSEGVTAEAQHALVPYNGGGTMVPYEGPYDPAKRRRPRPKVDLDPETSRVWRLLLIKDSIDGDTELDKNKEKWWEEERRVFRGRVDSFIARMHLVQGDRRFSPWKGSVVDSVVGVFLTQNVSDHLSSSAFMSLAAKFSFKANNQPNVEKEGKPFKPEHCISSFKDAIKFQELKGKESPHDNYIVTHEAEDTEEQIVDCHNSPGRHPQGDGPIGYTKDEGIFFHGSEVGASHPSPDSRIASPFTVSPSLSSSDTGLRNSPGDAASNQKSAISSQNSSEYPAQTVDQIGTSLESNPISEELSVENMCNFLDGYTSFTNLLKMAENTGFQKFYTSSNGGTSSEYGSVVNQLTSTESERGTSILDLLDNPDGACSSAVMPNNPDQACHDFMGVTSKSSTSNHDYSSTNFMSEEKATAYGAIEEGAHLPFASMNFMANNIVDRECITSVGNKADPTDKLESSTSQTTLLDACTPLQKIPLHQLDGSARENCFDKQLPPEALDTALSKRISMEEPKSHGQYLTKDQQINTETSALGEISQPTAAVQTRNSVVYQSPKSSNNTEQTTHNLGAIESKSNADVFISEKAPGETVVDGSNRKRPRADLERKKNFDWDSLRKQVSCEDIQTERSSDRMDSVDWEAVRLADVSEISETIRERGMNNMLAERIKDFLNRLVRDHGSVDLEWLRDVPPDKAKEYLLSIRGLGLKSVECVRLLTLHHLAFPVDTNVGRISVRLGWVPLQPLPESLQLHLLEMYPVLETIQKYLWPRLCRLDQRTLYELHYQLITFGKVFCTKSKPNCNACPMRGECKHFASAFASARLALPGPEEKGLVSSVTPIATENNQNPGFNPVPLPQLLEGNNLSQERTVMKNCEPIIEEPATPEPESVETSESAIEDYFDEDPDEIPVIKLNLEEFTQTLQNFMQENNLDIQEGDMSKALVALAPEAASIPMPKLKNVSRLRTEHQVYELPDGHPLLKGLDRREPDDPCSYLLAIWTPGETSQSNEPPKTCCNSQETGKLCDKITCFSCNSVREAQSQIVRATILIPCRTAMRGSFPLNGTYFQVNEVFADHESSHNPINVPRESIWNLPRRTVYFGTSIPSIFRGLSTEGIQHCFWRGFVCVRGFDRVTRAPRPLSRRLHFPASKVTRDKQSGPNKE